MLRLIDNTLTAFNHSLPSKEDLHAFCELLFIIGVDVIELSVAAFERMEYLPERHKFLLNMNYSEEIEHYPGFYRYVSRMDAFQDKLIHEVQLNDAREIIKLRTLQGCKELRIVGLDDLMCRYSYDKIMKELIHCLPNDTIILCPENGYGCASAIAVQWALDYGKDITTSFAGCNHNAATEEVLMAMRLAARYKPNRDLTVLPKLTKLYEKFTNTPVGNKKPIIGKNIFQVEAGIHADGIMKNPATYEAYKPCHVGGRTELVIGKHSGAKAVIMKLEELVIDPLDDIKLNLLLKRIKNTSVEKKRSLSDEEFAELVKEVRDYEGDKIHC